MVRKINKVNLLSALAITSLIFFSGFFLSGIVGGSKLSELQEIQRSLNLDSRDLDIQYSLALEDPCSLIGLSELNQRLTNMGDKLTYLGGKIGTKGEEFSVLRADYYLSEVKHWLFIKEVNKKCSEDYTYILYFYSDDCSSCGLQGATLTALKEENPSIMIYSFDINSELESLRTIKKLQNIDKQTLPILVINDDSYYGYMSKQNIEKEL